MPEITRWDKVSHGESCWMPPEFPSQGRLPLTPKQIERNLKKIRQDEARYHDKVSEKLGFRMSMTCCHSLHISLFFDGTNNNEPYDTKKASPPQWCFLRVKRSGFSPLSRFLNECLSRVTLQHVYVKFK